MSPLRIAVFGSPEAFYGETRLIFSLKKAFALLLYLSVEGGMHSRSKLAAFLWPDSDPHDARTALRNAIALLRNLLSASNSSSPQQVHLLSEHDLLGLNPHMLPSMDMDAIQRAWKQMQELPTLPSSEQRALLTIDWQQALAQVRGPFLEGFWLREESPFNEWLQSQQRQWQVRLQLLFDRLSSWQEADGEQEQAIATLTRWQTLDPLQEEVYKRLMRLHLAMGNLASALQVYTLCQTRLAEELQVQPSSEIRALAEHIRDVATTPYIQTMLESDPLAHEPSIPLAGRGADFSQLVTSYRQIRHGQPRATFLIGEAGIGKTRLASDFVAWARTEGADVLSGQAFEIGGRLPYQLLVEALRQRLDAENAPEDLLDDPWLAELARILPELRVRYPDLPASTEDELTAKVRLFEAVARLLDALAQRAPLILLLDDLHWADGPSLDLIRYLVRYWKGHRVPALLLGTIRSENCELNSSLLTQLADLERDLPVTHITLQPLSRGETMRLVQDLVKWNEHVEQRGTQRLKAEVSVGTQTAVVSSSAADTPVALLGKSLFDLTGGHPFYLVETLKTLRDKELLTVGMDTDNRWTLELSSARTQEYSWRELLPSSVRTMILARQASLSSDARQLLMACAVLGEQATAAHIWEITGLGMQAGIDALEEAINRGILHEGETGGNFPAHYLFTHNLIREVIYTEIGEARRHLLHQRALLLLQTEGATAAVLAYHALEAAKEREAYHYSIQAGDDAVLIFAFEDAIKHYERARSLLHQQRMLIHVQNGSSLAPSQDNEEQSSTFPDPEIEHLYVYLGRAYSFLYEWEKAQTVYEDLLIYANHMHLPALASITLNRLAILELQRSSEHARVHKLLTEAWQLAQTSQNQKAIAETEWNRAQIAILWEDGKQASFYGKHALELARVNKDKELEARSLCLLGFIYLSMGELRQAIQSLEAALAVYATFGKEQTSSIELSLPHFMVGAPTTQYLTNCASEALCLGLMAVAQVQSGQLQNGIHSARMALLLSKEIRNTWVQIESAICLIYVLLEAGTYEEAFIQARQTAELAQAIPLKVLRRNALTALASTLQALHQWKEARDVLEDATTNPATLDHSSFGIPIFSLLCMNYAVSGAWELAYKSALISLDRHTQHAIPPILDLYYHYEIEAFLHVGDESSARARLAQHSSDAHLRPYTRRDIPYLRSLAILDHWEKRRKQAIEHLHDALQIAEELGLLGEQWQLQVTLGMYYEEIKQKKQSQDAFSKAAIILRRLAENMPQGALQARFLAQPELQRLLQDYLTSSIGG